jgi:glucokinase
MGDILVADIGGTTSRVALLGDDGRPARIHSIANDDAQGPHDVIMRVIGSGPPPRGAVLAVAAPVDGDEIALTNRLWRFSLSELAARCAITRVHAINDFEALAWALPALHEADLCMIGHRGMPREGIKVVLGPGTGLGVAALVSVGGDWHVAGSEGGHVSFGAASQEEEDVFARLRAGRSALSAEYILSGPGLMRLHLAINPDAAPLGAEDILRAAHSGDAAARATASLFVRLLSRFAGDAALTFKATGGIYLAGGVAAGLGALLDAAQFRAAFEAHPPFEKWLANIPVALITCTEPGLIGCATVARRILQRV